jgi:predicted RecA/RadA family phage recombinase
MAFEAIWVSGGDTIDHTPGGAVAAGEVVEISANLVGVASTAIAAGELGTLVVGGVFDVVKEATTDTYAVGAAVYWDSSADIAGTTDDSASDNLLGYAVAAAAATDTTVRVLTKRP